MGIAMGKHDDVAGRYVHRFAIREFDDGEAVGHQVKEHEMGASQIERGGHPAGFRRREAPGSGELRAEKHGPVQFHAVQNLRKGIHPRLLPFSAGISFRASRSVKTSGRLDNGFFVLARHNWESAATSNT